MDFGDWQLGQEFPITLQATDGDTPTVPDRAPQLAMFTAAGTLIRRVLMPADTQSQQTGLFRLPLFLNENFSVGPIHGYIEWLVDGSLFAEPISFRILPGGSTDGTVISMTHVRRPSSNYLLWQTDAGTIFRGTNPRARR